MNVLQHEPGPTAESKESTIDSGVSYSKVEIGVTWQKFLIGFLNAPSGKG